MSESVNILFLEIHPFKRLHLKKEPVKKDNKKKKKGGKGDDDDEDEFG